MADPFPPADRLPRHASPWFDTSTCPERGPLVGDRTVDVAVVGAGITGLTTALLLQRAGASVAVVERHRVGGGTTGRSTAKVAALQSTAYSKVNRTRGAEAAAQYASANQVGVELVAELAALGEDESDLAALPAVTYAESADHRAEVEEEADAARAAGLDAVFTEDTDLPFPVAGAVRLDRQFAIHPGKYTAGLARALAEAGVEIFEHTAAHAVDVENGACRLRCDGGTIEADAVVLATLLPFLDIGLHSARTTASRSYCLLAAVDDGAATEGMYISVDEPTRSIRPHDFGDGTHLMIGGESHETGHDDETEARYAALDDWARERFAVRAVEYRWSAQDYTAVDDVPIVGPISRFRRQVLVATGMKKWGFSNGSAAAVLLSRSLTDREPPDWAPVFDSTRLVAHRSPGEYARHQFDVARRFFGDRVRRKPDVDSLSLGRGEIVQIDGKELAVAPDRDGSVHAVSPVCTHLGCLVAWNGAEGTWDCPCHGSRFAADGAVLEGPATEPLERFDLPEDTRATGEAP